jgi:UPF0176 protein
MKLVVLSFYRFVLLSDIKALQKKLQDVGQRLSLKGTVLLSEEGINASLQCPNENEEEFRNTLNEIPGLQKLCFKTSPSSPASFRRFSVKIKAEIVTLRKPTKPYEKTGAFISPKDLKSWYDQKRDFIIVDTRNHYEFDLGTFKGAINPKTKSFSQFADWVDQNADELKGKTVVTFCTGGIRCEKATAYMLDKGIPNVYQLEGGVLNYFEALIDEEETHWKGDLVVFDKRKALTSKLQISSKSICHSCLKEVNESTRGRLDHPAGEVCMSCDESMRLFHEKRVELGRKKHALRLGRLHKVENHSA